MFYNSIAYRSNDKVFFGIIDQKEPWCPLTEFKEINIHLEDDFLSKGRIYVVAVDDTEGKNFTMLPIHSTPVYDPEGKSLDVGDLDDDDTLCMSNGLLREWNNTTVFH